MRMEPIGKRWRQIPALTWNSAYSGSHTVPAFSGQWAILPGMEVVTTDSQEISNSLDDRVHRESLVTSQGSLWVIRGVAFRQVYWI